jgi:hypothetical protein
VIGMFPNYGGYANNNRPITNPNGRAVLKSINVPCTKSNVNCWVTAVKRSS